MTWNEPGSAYFADPQFPLAIRRMAPQHPTPFHGHDFSELVIVTSGETVHVIRNRTGGAPLVRLLTAGNAFSIHPGQQHSYRITRGFHLINLLYDSRKLRLPPVPLSHLPGYRSLLHQSATEGARDFDTGLIHLNGEELARAVTIAAELDDELVGMRPGWDLGAQGAFLQLLTLVARAYAEHDPMLTSLPDWMPSVLSHLETGDHAGLTLDSLAEVARTSPSNLSHAFSRTYGCGPIEYAIAIRVQKAAELLRDTEMPISQVAWEAGFPDSNYFSRQFKRHMNYTPSRYRAHYHRLGQTARRFMPGV